MSSCDTPLTTDSTNSSRSMNSSNNTDYSLSSGSINLRGPRTKIKFSVSKPVQLKNKMHDISVPAIKFSTFSYASKVNPQAQLTSTVSSESTNYVTEQKQTTVSTSSIATNIPSNSAIPTKPSVTPAVTATSMVKASPVTPNAWNIPSSTPAAPVWNVPPPITPESAWNSPQSTSSTSNTQNTGINQGNTTPGSSPQLLPRTKPR